MSDAPEPPAAALAPPAPYVAADGRLPELTVKAIVIGMVFGVIF